MTSCTASTASRRTRHCGWRYFGTTPEFWLNLQMLWELETTRDKVGADIKRSITPRTPEAA